MSKIIQQLVDEALGQDAMDTTGLLVRPTRQTIILNVKFSVALERVEAIGDSLRPVGDMYNSRRSGLIESEVARALSEQRHR
ncbi:MAG: hypothetical protein ABL932_09715, partial [Terricaulis sp.]